MGNQVTDLIGNQVSGLIGSRLVETALISLEICIFDWVPTDQRLNMDTHEDFDTKSQKNHEKSRFQIHVYQLIHKSLNI